MLDLDRFSVGVGDRFAHQSRPQLRTFHMQHLEALFIG